MENAEVFPQNEDISRREVLSHESCPESLTSEWITFLFGHHPPPPPKWSYLQNGVQILCHEALRTPEYSPSSLFSESILWVDLQCLVLIRVPRFLRAFHCEWASVSRIPCPVPFSSSFIQHAVSISWAPVVPQTRVDTRRKGRQKLFHSNILGNSTSVGRAAVENLMDGLSFSAFTCRV